MSAKVGVKVGEEKRHKLPKVELEWDERRGMY